MKKKWKKACFSSDFFKSKKSQKNHQILEKKNQKKKKIKKNQKKQEKTLKKSQKITKN